MDLILHIMIVQNLCDIYHDERSCIINYACMISVIYARNEILGHFLEFGTSGGFDIDITSCFLRFGYGIRSCAISNA